MKSEYLEAFFLRVVGDEHALILHHLSDVSRLASRRCCHVEDLLSRLRSESEDRQERTGRLQHVVASEVLRSGADGYFRLIDFKTDLRPVSDRLEFDSPSSKGLSEVFSSGLERVGPDSRRPLFFHGFEEGGALSDESEPHEARTG